MQGTPRRYLVLAAPALAAVVATSHALADGPVRAWGLTTLGIPGNIGRARLIATGFNAAAAVCSDGQVRWWRMWSNGAGIDISQVPRTLGDVRQLDLGDSYGLVLRADGSVGSWGFFGASSVPADLGECSAIAAAYQHALALRTDGSVRAWGTNQFGTTQVPSSLGTVVAIDTMYLHNLVVQSDGTVVGWGDNSQGQSSPPTGLGDVVGIAAGLSHSVAMRSDGTIACWGSNSSGECSPPADLGPVARVAAGGATTTVEIGRAHV